MRRWLNIKVSIIGLAWLVIFLHSAIPHNHSDDLCTVKHEVIHSDCSDQQDSDDNNGSLLSHSDRDEKVCHFSTNPFLKFTVDYHFLVNSYSDIIPAKVRITSYVEYKESDFIGPPLISSLTLRGPPLV